MQRPHCRCGLPLSSARRGEEDYVLCGRCVLNPPPFRQLVVARRWGFPLDRLISGYKYRGALSLEPALLRIWTLDMGRCPKAPPDALVPVPLHWRRHWWRGFNQAGRLALGLGAHHRLPVLHALARARATPAQQTLSSRARRMGPRGSFRVRGSVEGLHLALVDDVVTTASTVREAARVLRAAGAARVDVWALARALPSRDD